MMLLELPEEILLLILKKCAARDLAALAQTCARFAELTQIDTLWKAICWRECGSTDLGKVHNYYNLYSKVLHKHSWMLGMFQCLATPYGGLLEVTCHDGAVQGFQWKAKSSSLKAPLDKVPMFEINSTMQYPKCLSHRKKSFCPSAEIRKIDNESFVYECVEEFINCPHGGQETSYKKLNNFNSSEIPLALKLKNGTPSSKIITPGLFIAKYSSHGIEMIFFSFVGNEEIHGVKVTGDPNVFSGKLSVKFNIKYLVSPSLEVQSSFEALRSLSPVESDMSLTRQDSAPEQRFILPDDCYYEEVEDEFPSVCKARYHGYGQIASHNFQNPSFTPAHIVIFNDDLIGVLWLDLDFFMLFLRKNMY